MVIVYRGKARPQTKLGQHLVVNDLIYPCLLDDTVCLSHLIICLHWIVFNYSIHSLNHFAIIRLFHFKIGNFKYSLNLTNFNRTIQYKAYDSILVTSCIEGQIKLFPQYTDFYFECRVYIARIWSREINDFIVIKEAPICNYLVHQLEKNLVYQKLLNWICWNLSYSRCVYILTILCNYSFQVRVVIQELTYKCLHLFTVCFLRKH